MSQTDISKIESFRQFKRQIRGSKQYLIVGIDIAKSKHHAFIGTVNGKTVLKPDTKRRPQGYPPGNTCFEGTGILSERFYQVKRIGP